MLYLEFLEISLVFVLTFFRLCLFFVYVITYVYDYDFIINDK